MENNYEDICCIKNRRKRCCGEYMLAILFVAFAVVLGLILGAVFSTAIMAAMSSIIIFAITIVLLIIIRIISLFCKS